MPVPIEIGTIQRSAESPGHNEAAQPGVRSPRLLLVEDDFIAAFAAEDDLTIAGYEVIGVASLVDEAVRRAQTERPDLVLMDVCLLGERDGVDASIEIYRTTGIRTIFITASFDTETRMRAQAANPLGWLRKPYTRQSLFNSVTNALQQLKDA